MASRDTSRTEDPTIPRYQQLKAHIVAGIQSGRLQPRDRVPSEQDLVRRFGVSRMTANRALRELASDGIVVRQSGVGTFVAEAQSRSHALDVRNIADEIRERGHVHGARLVRMEKLAAGRDIANRLGLRPGGAVFQTHHSATSCSLRLSSPDVAVVDTVLSVKALGEGQADPLAENDVELVFEKHRRFGGDAARTIRAKAIGDADGYVTWQAAGADPLLDDVVRLHRTGHSVRDMAEILKRSKAGIEKAISRAKAAGKWPLGESA